MVRNTAPPTDGPGLRAACSTAVTLTSGTAYSGDTSLETNKYYNDAGIGRFDYPNLVWNETGPDAVHRLVVASTCDLRIHLDPDPLARPDLDLILVPGVVPLGCDTSNWLYAGDDTILYPDCPPGSYYIIVDGYTAADKGKYTLTAAAARGLLLVDNDGSGGTLCEGAACADVRSFYTTALAAMTTPPQPTPLTTWDVATQGAPPANTLNNAKYVIWFAGEAWGDSDPGTPPLILTDAVQALLADYLDLGGRILMVGQDILWDLMGGWDGRLGDGEVLSDYFQVDAVYHDAWTYNNTSLDAANCSATYNSYKIWGVPGNPLSDLLNCNDAAYYWCQYAASSGAPYSPNADSLVSRYGEPVYYNAYRSPSSNRNTQKPAGLRYASYLALADTSGGATFLDYFKTLYLAFGPECAKNTGDNTTWQTNMRTLFERTIAWFDLDGEINCPLTADAALTDPVDAACPACNNDGIPDPGEEVHYTITLYNYDTVPHYAKVYESFQDYYLTTTTPYCSGRVTVPAASGGNPGSVTLSGTPFEVKVLNTTPNTRVGYEMLPGFNLINDDGASEAFCGRAGFGSFVGKPDLLLVKDEELLPNTTGVDLYADTTWNSPTATVPGLMSQLGLTYAVWDTSVFGSPVYDAYATPTDNLYFYPFVFWFTGFDFIWTLTPDPWDAYRGINPEEEIADYLAYRQTDTGDEARLLLSSQDYLYDRYKGASGAIPPSDFAYTQLKVSAMTQDYVKDADTTVKGIDGQWPAEKMAMPLFSWDSGGFVPTYADRINGNFDEAATQYQWTYALPAANAAVGNLDKARASKFIFMAFPFENVQDASSPAYGAKLRFLEKAMCQMLMTSSDTVPPCGYSAPACAADPTIYGQKTGPTDGLFTWAPSSFSNALGEPIYGRYAMFGAPDNPNPAAFTLLAVSGLPEYSATQSVAPGHCHYYQLTGYRDDFDQTGALCATYGISGAVSGATASGVLMTLSGSASSTTTTDGGGGYAFSGLIAGNYTVTPSKTGFTFSPASRSYSPLGSNQTGQNFTAAAVCNANAAAYNATYKTPACTSTGKSCDTGASLIMCRASQASPGPEPNQPNTVNTACADGTSGSCHSDESVEQLTIATADGASCLAVGQSVTVTARFYCYGTSDYLALYYAASVPGTGEAAWALQGAVTPCPAAGYQNLTRTFALAGSAGTVQAVRAQITFSTSPTSACQTGSYNDRDDLVFRVQ
jgi:hypothetical protein